jgi:hypothetical protein
MNGWLVALAIVVLLLLGVAQVTGTIIGFVQVRRLNRDAKRRNR